MVPGKGGGRPPAKARPPPRPPIAPVPAGPAPAVPVPNPWVAGPGMAPGFPFVPPPPTHHGHARAPALPAAGPHTHALGGGLAGINPGHPGGFMHTPEYFEALIVS